MFPVQKHGGKNGSQVRGQTTVSSRVYVNKRHIRKRKIISGMAASHILHVQENLQQMAKQAAKKGSNNAYILGMQI